MSDSLRWTLSPSNSRVFHILAVGYVLVFGGFFLLVGTALFAFIIFGLQSVYAFLLAVLTLLLLLAYRRRSPTMHNETWKTLRSSLGNGPVVLTGVLGAVAYATAFVVFGRLTLLLFGVSALGVGLLVGTVGGFHVEGRFDSPSGRVESGDSKVRLADVTFSQPKRVGDIVVTRPRSVGDGGSTAGILVFPEHVFRELQSELALSQSSSALSRVSPTVPSLKGPQLLLIAFGCLFMLVGISVPVLSSRQDAWIFPIVLLPMGLVFVGLGFATASEETHSAG